MPTLGATGAPIDDCVDFIRLLALMNGFPHRPNCRHSSPYGLRGDACGFVQQLRRGLPLVVLWFLLAISWIPTSRLLAFDPFAAGRALYQQQCATCHGRDGEGVADKFDEPLYGNRSLESLTGLIERTMPEEEPELCRGEDAHQVAAFIYHTFYSPAARQRNQPPRIELARLTVPQFENSIADLLATFQNRPNLGQEHGLKAEYYDARNTARDKLILERTDATVRFDWGEDKPLDEITEADTFAMRWTGSIRVEETGDYSFMLRTENGARLWVNDNQLPLIDAWVSSGETVREEQATLKLLGGRDYPVQIAFFKYKDKTASLEWRWRPPHQSWETVPSHALSPISTRPTFVVQTAFPPDDSSAGYERGTAVSRAWDQAATHAALEVVDAVMEQADRLAETAAGAEDRGEKYRAFALRFAERAFRRPLNAEQSSVYVDGLFAVHSDPETALKRSILMILKAPWFLYPELNNTPNDSYTLANRLALFLWDSIPDKRLWNLAADGSLAKPQRLRAEAERMVQDPRARTKLAEFFHHWLELDEAEDISKDPNLFPGFNDALLADLRTSLNLFLDEVVWGPTSDYRELLLANHLHLNQTLADFYGIDLTSQPEDPRHFLRVSLPDTQRTGLITHPYLLSIFAYYKNSSPIHRGVFLSRNVLGRALRPPPMAIEFMDGRFDPDLTMREKVTELTSPANCQSCHTIINPLGFSLEHFDAVGRFRTIDNGKQVDATSDYPLEEGTSIRISGARDVAEHAVNSPDAHRSFVRQLFQHITKQTPFAYAPDTLDQLTERFTGSGFHIRNLLVDLAVTSSSHTHQDAALLPDSAL